MTSKWGNMLTIEEVKELIRSEAEDSLTATNHGMTLKQALIHPQRIPIIERTVSAGRTTDRNTDVWLVGRENIADGYLIILRDGDRQFGLASKGFPTDKCPILVGWYGALRTAFLGM